MKRANEDFYVALKDIYEIIETSDDESHARERIKRYHQIEELDLSDIGAELMHEKVNAYMSQIFYGE